MYKFRFEFIDNIRGVTAGINRQFASMRAAAKSFADQIRSSGVGKQLLSMRDAAAKAFMDQLRANRAGNLEQMVTASQNFFNPERVLEATKSVIGLNDSLAVSEQLILGITRSNDALVLARQEAKELSRVTGVSVAEATSGLATMLRVTKGNVKEASDFTALASALVNLKPEKTFEEAVRALGSLSTGDGASLQEMFDFTGMKSIQQLKDTLDQLYGGGKKGEGVNFLMTVDDRTIGGQLKRIKASFVNAFTPIITSVGPQVTKFFTGISAWVADNEEAIRRFAPPVLAVVGAFAGFAAIGSIISGITAAVSSFGVVLGVLTSPVTLVVVGVAALTYGVIQLRNNFKGFRGFLVGFFNTVKELGKILIERMIAPFKALGKLVVGIFTGDWKMIKSSFTDSLRAFDFKGDMQRLGNAAREGYQQGVDAKPITFGFGKKKGDGKKDEGASIYQTLAGGATGSGAGAANANSGAGTKAKADGSISGDGMGSGKNVYININKLVESITIQSSNLADSASRIKEEVARALLSAVNDYNYAN